MNFDQLGLEAPLLKALDEQEYKTPTPIQAKAIPPILEGKDVMAAAQTGTGKTAAFTLPILSRLSKGQRAKPGHVRTLILTPTRELAAQVAQSVATYGKHLSITCTVVFGGVKINPQMSRLRKGIDILVATPGRLLDLYQQNAIGFGQLEVLVLDEADRMLDMGFINDIKKIIAVLPKKRQNLLFSATFSDPIRQLAKGLMNNNPIEVSVSPPNSTVELVKQWVHPVDKKQKTALLSHLIWEGRWEQVLVFAKTKHGANRLAEYLVRDGMTAVAIHGNKSQGARTRALSDFKEGLIRVLVATDIAARGLDIELLPHVVNFDMPHVAEDYVHRIGRTGRAGASGEAISLVSADEFGQLADIERLIKQKLTRKEVDGFVPKHTVPERAENKSRAPRTNKAKPSARYSREASTRNNERSNRSSTSDRSERFERRERPAKAQWSPRGDRSERSERPVKKEWTPRDDRSERSERPARKEWTPRGDHSERSERPARKEWTPRGDHSERSERPAKKEWTPRGDRSERSERPARKEWTPRTDRSERPAKKEWTPRGDHSERSERPARKEWTPRADRSERPAKKEWTPRGERSERSERPAKKEWTPRGENATRSSDRSTRAQDPAKAEWNGRNARPHTRSNDRTRRPTK